MEHRPAVVGGTIEPARVITVITFLWGDKFGADDVAKLFSAVRRNLKQPARFIAVSEWNLNIEGVECIPIRDIELTKIKGCYARLRMFDRQWQCDYKIEGRIVLIDLDTVITGELDPLFDRPEPFVIMQGGNSTNPCLFNGALQMLRTGCHSEIWDSFTVDRASRVPFYEFPDDQGWLWARLPNAAGWKCGPESGVYVFHKPGWQGWEPGSKPSDKLPKGARLVTFSGWRNPARFDHLDWVRDNWRL